MRLATTRPFSTLHAQPLESEPFAPVSQAISTPGRAQRMPTWPPGNSTPINSLEAQNLSTSYTVHPSYDTHLAHSRMTLPCDRIDYPPENTGNTGLDERRRSNWSEHRVEDANAYRVREAAPQSKIYPDLDSSVTVVEFISSQYERAFRMMAFNLASCEENFVQESALAGIRLSRSSCWSLFLGAKIFQAIMSNHNDMCVRPYLKVLDRFAGQVASVTFNDITMRELVGWLSAALELFEIRLLADHRPAYKVLRLAAPIFVQVVYADTTMWTKQGSLRHSLHKTLASSRVDLVKFATNDVVMAMLFGLPQLVPWDPTFLSSLSHGAHIEWWPGCPLEFILAFARVNVWRAQAGYMRTVDEWHQIEKDVWSWQPPHTKDQLLDSWGSITRLAVQEAIRHMVLVYVYMGMCGLTNVDSRVQASSKQIMKLLNLVEANPSVAPHFFFPAIVAGVCAINEKHRCLVRDVLCRVKACRVFTFRDLDFPEVMDHLWHGVAVNGATVTWDDYLISCRAVIKLEEGC